MNSDKNCQSPKLRFPEFSSDWKEFQFRDITFPAGKKNKRNLPYERYSISNELGFYPQSEQFEVGGGYLKDIDCSLYSIVPPHSFAYNPARINVGSIGYQNLGKDVIVSSLYEVFQTTKDCDDLFLWHWLHSDVFHRMVMDTQEGGVRQYFFYDKLCGCTILLPSLLEQQKIAECLSAVDESIVAQQEKVDALKAKKKGLMQQLFPQDGETTPRLRFPGFTGEWEEKRLGDVIRLAKGSQVNGSKLNKTTGFPMMNGGSTLSGYYSSYNCESNTIIISEGGNSCGFVNYMKERFWAGGHCYTVTPRDKDDVDFLYHVLKFNENKIMALRVGSGLPNIQSKSLLEFIVVFPPTSNEHRKIASCLSSFDETIAAEEQKVEALKLHKKGLMQQLFPQPSK